MGGSFDRGELEKLFGCFDRPLRDAEFGQEADRLKLPTNSEVAAASFGDFVERSVLLSAETRLKLLNEPNIQDAIFGWDAEFVIQDSESLGIVYTEEEIALIEQAFAGSGFAVVRFADFTMGDAPIKRFCFMNLRAAERVTECNEGVFKGKIVGDRQEWLRAHIESLMNEDTVASGVLSGYAEESARQFDRLNRLEADQSEVRSIMNQRRNHVITIDQMEDLVSAIELRIDDKVFLIQTARYFAYCDQCQQGAQGKNDFPNLFSEAEMDFWRQRVKYADRLSAYYDDDLKMLKTV